MKQVISQTNFFLPDFIDFEPAIITLASDIATPVDIFARLTKDQGQAFLLESTEGDGRLARYSFLGFDPLLSIVFKDGIVSTKTRSDAAANKHAINNPVRFLEEVSQFYLQKLVEAQGKDQFNHFFEQSKDLPFTFGLAGYMGYNASCYLEKIPQQMKDPQAVPEGYYGFYDSTVVFDHQYRSVYILSLRGEECAKNILHRILTGASLPPLALTKTKLTEETIFEGVETSFSKEEYIQALQKTKEFIRQGEAFQIALSQRFSTPSFSDSLDVYRILQATNPSPYAYYLKYPEFVYLGSSPETLLQSRENRLLLRAIAGTRPRGKNAQEDNLLSTQLKSDEKEMAEHRMLVDLGRNDLGRVCKPGTVKPNEIGLITKYTHVMHMVTAIQGELDNKKSSFDAFQSCFPAGTVSGAPKIRAMQLLSQIEPEKRGIYSGSVGYFALTGNMDNAIAIRSVLIKNKMAYVNAGGGIVYDSDPEAEYQESRNKAKSVLQAVKLGELLIK